MFTQLDLGCQAAQTFIRHREGTGLGSRTWASGFRLRDGLRVWGLVMSLTCTACFHARKPMEEAGGVLQFCCGTEMGYNQQFFEPNSCPQ